MCLFTIAFYDDNGGGVHALITYGIQQDVGTFLEDEFQAFRARSRREPIDPDLHAATMAARNLTPNVDYALTELDDEKKCTLVIGENGTEERLTPDSPRVRHLAAQWRAQYMPSLLVHMGRDVAGMVAEFM